MKVASFQGIPIAYYLRNGKNELKAVKAIKSLNKDYAIKAVKVDISPEAKALNVGLLKK